MPQIPLSNIDARSGRSQSSIDVSGVTPDAFGAGVGRATQQFGAAVGDAGQTLLQIATEQGDRKRKADNAAIDAQNPFDKTAYDLQSKVPADGTGYHDVVIEAYHNQTEDIANGIQDDRQRQEFRDMRTSRLKSVSDGAAAWEVKAKQANTLSTINDGLNANLNNVLSNPASYDMNVQLSNDMIAGQNYPAPLREEMAKNQQATLAKTRFEGMLLKAKSVQDYDAVAADLNSERWKNEMHPTEYQDTFNKVQAAKRAFATQADTAARAGVKALKDRSDDPTSLIPADEMKHAAELVSNAVDARGEVANEFARINRNQTLVRTFRNLTPTQIQAQIDKNLKDGTATFSPEVDAAIASATRIGESASLVQRIIGPESGGQIDAKNPNSSASGLGQFVEETWIGKYKDGKLVAPGLMRDPAVIAALQPEFNALKNDPKWKGKETDPTKMTDAELLDLRFQPGIATTAIAILAKQNRAQMERALGRQVSDTEVYLSHAFGANKAISFMQALQVNPEANAAKLFPTEAEGHPGYFGKGTRSLADTYEAVARSFVPSPSQMAYADNQTLKSIKDKKLASLNSTNALADEASMNGVSLLSLDQPGAFAALGGFHQATELKYGMQVKPFTPDNEAFLLRQIESGSVDSVLGVLASVQTMGRVSAREGFDQLKVKNPEFGHAGMLALDGESAVAGDIIRGAKRMKENPSMLKAAEMIEGAESGDFQQYVGSAMSGLAPVEREATQKAALAYLAETRFSNGGKYRPDEYKAALQKVLGNRIGKVNGDKVLLPKGVSDTQLDFTLEHMKAEDYVAMSESGTIPLHANGQTVDFKDIGSELKLQAIGNDKYRVRDATGGLLATRRTQGAPLEDFVLDLRPDRVMSVFTRNRQLYPYIPDAQPSAQSVDPDAGRNAGQPYKRTEAGTD